MNTSNTNLRSRASFVVLASLLGSLGSLGCIIDAKIGDDPMSDGGETTQGETESPPEETSTSAFPGYTSGAEPGTASATTTTAGEPGTASATSGSPTMTSAGEDDGSTLDALEQCGVVVVPPEPGGPLYQEGIECEDGCQVDVESAEPTGIYEQGECICEALGCGSLGGGTTGTTGEPGDTESPPDGCGPFPDGQESFICGCEMCSIVVNDVDAAWLAGEADLQAICECMCGGAGCGAPV